MPWHTTVCLTRRNHDCCTVSLPRAKAASTGPPRRNPSRLAVRYTLLSISHTKRYSQYTKSRKKKKTNVKLISQKEGRQALGYNRQPSCVAHSRRTERKTTTRSGGLLGYYPSARMIRARIRVCASP